jgi:hypothetical protein
MPLTFLAHQAPLMPLKFIGPRWIDGTAMCIGAAAPDLGYPLSDYLPFHTHSLGGALTWGWAWTVAATILLRRWVAAVVFAQLPDLGRLRVHSFRVLAWRRPPLWQTLTSALFGAASHVLLDSFTHTGRFGANLFGLNFEVVTIRGSVLTAARVLQYSLIVFGSLAGVWLLARMGRTRKLESWYGDEAVRAARTFSLPMVRRVAFWVILALGLPAGVLWSRASGYLIFSVVDATLGALLVASLLPICRPRGMPGPVRVRVRPARLPS